MLLENVSTAVAAIAESENAHDVSLENPANDEKDAADLIVLKGGFSTSDQSYKFEIKSDGTGKIFYTEYHLNESEEFSHEADLRELEREIEALFAEEMELRKAENLSADVSDLESARDEIAAERLEEFFWEEINSTLEDPFFRSTYDDDGWGEDFHCENGTTKEFEEFLELCVMTERAADKAEAEDYLVVVSESDCYAAGLDESSFYTERLNELVEIACEHFKPAGYHYEYNDGCGDRYSGYCESPESITVSLKEFARVPAREKMLGMKKLKAELARMNVEPGRIERLTSF
jgi:hypothetical protein